MDKGIGLRKVVDQLREELFALTETVSGEDLRFAVESVEVELHVGVAKEGGGSGKVSFWVVEIGGEAKYATEQTQTIKLTLKPRRKDVSVVAATPAATAPTTGASEPEEILIRRK